MQVTEIIITTITATIFYRDLLPEVTRAKRSLSIKGIDSHKHTQTRLENSKCVDDSHRRTTSPAHQGGVTSRHRTDWQPHKAADNRQPTRCLFSVAAWSPLTATSPFHLSSPPGGYCTALVFSSRQIGKCFPVHFHRGTDRFICAAKRPRYCLILHAISFYSWRTVSTYGCSRQQTGKTSCHLPVFCACVLFCFVFGLVALLVEFLLNCVPRAHLHSKSKCKWFESTRSSKK